MSVALEITLIVVLVAIASAMVPLLFQLRRTAQGLDSFLLSTRRDLCQIAEDVHASRLRMDHLAVSLQSSLDELSTFAQTMGELGGMVKSFHNQFHSSIESASRNLGSLLGGLSSVLTFFKRPKNQQETE
jgi:hypothetical protein